MDIKQLQATIDEYWYWDSRVLEVTCNHFADEVKIVYEDDELGDVTYEFFGCYKVHFDHVVGYSKDKPSRQLTRGQIPYFIQDVAVTTQRIEDVDYMNCKIDMFPINVEIICTDMKVSRSKVS